MSAIFKYSVNHHNFFSKHGEKVTYKRNHLLVDSNANSPYVYFLEGGIVKASFTSRDGSERLLGFFMPGSTFAQSGSFFSDPTAGIIYEVMEKSELYRLPSPKFYEHLKQDNEFALDYLQTVLRINLFLLERIIYQGEKDVDAKFCRWLLFMNKFYGIENQSTYTIPIPMTQDTIANFLHTSRESINKIIKKLSAKDKIRVDKKQIVILDLEGLKTK